ncbi:hypothetical protein ACFU3J_34365 [Streptomyces sp. NPDC057411]
MSNTDAQGSNGSGKHRGEAAPAEDSGASTAAPNGRHRREPEGR